MGQVSSRERGELVTLCCVLNAVGNAFPLYFIFARVKFFVKMMLSGAFVGSKGMDELRYLYKGIGTLYSPLKIVP